MHASKRGEGESRFRPLVELVGAGFDIHNVSGGTAACNIDMVRALLEIGGTEDILRGNSVGDTAIHVAALGSSLEVIEALFEKLGEAADYSVCSFEEKLTPLHSAMRNEDSVGVARYLIQHGANVHARNESGLTPLHYAARFGNVAALNLLHELEILDVDDGHITALHYAALYGRFAAAEWLLNHGADFDRKDTNEGDLPLHWAAGGLGDEDGLRTELVELLLTRQRVDRMLMENVSGQNVLQLLEQAGHTRIISPALDVMVKIKGVLKLGVPNFVLVRYILQYGGNDLNSDLVDSLAIVAKQSRTAVVDLFRERDGEKELSLLEWAAIKGDISMSYIHLAEQYLGQEQLELQLESAFQLSLLHKNLKFAEMLGEQLEYKEKITTWIKGEGMKVRLFPEAPSLLEGERPLAFLIFYFKRSHIEWFIKDHNLWEGIINEKDPKFARTALHWATILGDKEIVSELCNVKQCRGDIADRDGKMAYEYMERPDIQKELCKGEDVQSYVDRMYRDRQVFVDASNAMLVGAALIAGITFSGFLQPPFGNSREPKGLQVFWACNSLSFFFAMATVLAGARGVLPKPNISIAKAVHSIRHWLVVTSTLLLLSVTFSLGAFAAAGFSQLPRRMAYENSMIGTLAIGASVCTPILLLFAKGIAGIAKEIAGIAKRIAGIAKGIVVKGIAGIAKGIALLKMREIQS